MNKKKGSTPMWFLQTYDSNICREKRYKIFIALFESSRIIKETKRLYHDTQNQQPHKIGIVKLHIDSLHIRISILREVFKIPIHVYRTHAAREIRNIKKDILFLERQHHQLNQYHSKYNQPPSLLARAVETFYAQKNSKIQNALDELSEDRKTTFNYLPYLM